MHEIDIDLGDLPGYIGRANNKRIDYRYTDVPAILHEIDKCLRWHQEGVCVTITGIMPVWLSMDITAHMFDKYEENIIDIFRYVTPHMIENGFEPYVIFPKEVGIMDQMCTTCRGYNFDRLYCIECLGNAMIEVGIEQSKIDAVIKKLGE